MSLLFARIASAKRKRWLGSVPIFKAHKSVSEDELAHTETQLGSALPDPLRRWLLTVGYGDINDVLSFRKEWFRTIDRGELRGQIMFAQDDLGNFYSVSPSDGAIHVIYRSTPKYASMAESFESFLEKLEQQAFDLHQWTNNLESLDYHWGTTDP